MQRLLKLCKQLDKKSYKAYKEIAGQYRATTYTLAIDYVQGDPFASPSKIRLIIPSQQRPLHASWLEPKIRKVAVEDVLARAVAKAVRNLQIDIKGSGKSGAIFFDAPKQQVIERTAVQISPDAITVCLSVGLPANGRRINGRQAQRLFSEAIPAILQQSIFAISDEEINQAVVLADQQAAIRDTMKENSWIGFVANGAILPRKSGVNDLPLKDAIHFQSPKSFETEISIPHQCEPLKGMAIPKGVTLIVGGGYHGKSTLLHALEMGVYNHVKGDGREYVLTDPDAVKIRAEDGRQVSNVDISAFIRNLPLKQDTTHFSTENASGSTSQAANVVEALEAGASTLLLDEDTCATNFMIRDMRMQQLVSKAQEPIIPFIENVGRLRDELGISTILVMGGSGDYFDICDHVIMMENFLPKDVTKAAKEIAVAYPQQRQRQEDEKLAFSSNRVFKQQSLKVFKGKRAKVQAKGLTTILMGQTNISFSETEQLVDLSQTRMIAQILLYMYQNNELGQQTLHDLLDEIETQMDAKGLASFTPHPHQHPGDLARPRRYEIAAVLNRMRTAKVEQK